MAGQLDKLPVKNGDRVSAGQVLAVLVQVGARQNLAQAEINLKNAKVNFDDLLIRHTAGDTNSISSESVIYQNSSLSSGYAAALQAYKNADYELESTVLKAPFGGKVANLTSHLHEQVGTANIFCTVIDDSKFYIEFYLLESEIAQVSLRDEIRVIPFARDKEYIGYVSEINPVINDKGMVRVKGILRNEGSLWEGMNAKVVIGKDIPGQLVVPKTAVVLRQGEEVLFTFEEGKASWIYINILFENSSSYAVEANPERDATLEAGAYVITSGNLNLAHESDVRIKK